MAKRVFWPKLGCSLVAHDREEATLSNPAFLKQLLAIAWLLTVWLTNVRRLLTVMSKLLTTIRRLLTIMSKLLTIVSKLLTTVRSQP